MIGQAVNKIGEASAGISELLSSKREFIIKQITNTVLLLIILVVFGCFDFLHLKFHWEYLIDSNFWISVFAKAAADVAACNIGINVIIDEVIKQNVTLQKLKSTYDLLNKYKDKDFEEFIRDYNKECRKAAYKNKINHKIYNLNKFARNQDKILYNSKLVSDEEKLKNKYCVKRRNLELLKTDEYIDANIDSLDIRYDDIDAAVFEVEINGTEKVIENKVTGSVNKGRLVTSFTTLLGVILGPIIVSSITLDPNKEQFEEGVIAAANYAIKISTDIGIIIWQFSRGILSTHKIVSKEITNPLAVRVGILKKYYSRRLENGKSVPQCYLDLMEEPEYVEMTEEQYNKLKEGEN